MGFEPTTPTLARLCSLTVAKAVGASLISPRESGHLLTLADERFSDLDRTHEHSLRYVISGRLIYRCFHWVIWLRGQDLNL